MKLANMDEDCNHWEDAGGMERLAYICCLDKELWMQLEKERPDLVLQEESLGEKNVLCDRPYMDKLWLHIRKVTDEFYSRKRKCKLLQ